MCGTRDLGIKWHCWHTLVFSDEAKNDMRNVCPRDVENMLVQRTRSAYWKKCAGKAQTGRAERGKHGSNQLWLFCERKRKGFGLRSIVMWPEGSSWKEVGRKREYSILAGRMSVSVRLARWR